MKELDYGFILNNNNRLYTQTELSIILDIPRKFIKLKIPFNDVSTRYKPKTIITYLYNLMDAYNYLKSDKGAHLLKEYYEERGIYEEYTYNNCKVCWLERHGYYPHFKYTEREIYNATVVIKRNHARITKENGLTFTKKTTTHRFYFLENCTAPGSDNDVYYF